MENLKERLITAIEDYGIKDQLEMFDAEDMAEYLIEVMEELGNKNGCGCCMGDDNLYWKDNENNAFVDSKGEMLVSVKDRSMRFKVEYCPNCGRKFEQIEQSPWEDLCWTSMEE